MGKALKVVGWFFGILFILFGLFLVFEVPIAGFIVMFIGALICYGGHKSGGSSSFNPQQYFRDHEEEFKRYDFWRRHHHRP
jgi:hypothetical protein